MNKALGSIEGQTLMGGPCREKVQTVVSSHINFHEREAAGWSYLSRAFERMAPTTLEEVALYEILSRARRETRY